MKHKPDWSRLERSHDRYYQERYEHRYLLEQLEDDSEQEDVEKKDKKWD